MSGTWVPVVVTGAVGAAGIAAAFFAPTWSQRWLEEWRDERRFRRARRLIGNELNEIRMKLLAISAAGVVPPAAPLAAGFLPRSAWDSSHSDLAELLQNDADWTTLADAYLMVAQVQINLERTALTAGTAAGTAQAPLPVDLANLVENGRMVVQFASQKLKNARVLGVARGRWRAPRRRSNRN